MLRYSFLPSDYNPMVLLLGEAEDLRLLGGTLRHFAAEPREARFEELGFAAPDGGTTILLRPASDRAGMRRTGEGEALEWLLSPDQARAFAEQLYTLASPDSPAGSEMLGPDAANAREGIPVKASRGEFSDGFLVSER